MNKSNIALNCLLPAAVLLQVLLERAASLAARDRRGRAAVDYAPAGEV